MHRDYIDILDAELSQKYLRLEQRVAEDVVRRIQKTGEITATADWQLYRMYNHGATQAELRELVRDAVGGNEAVVREVFSEALRQDYMYMDDLYAAVGKSHIPFEQNAQFKQTLEAAQRQCTAQLDNMTQTQNIGYTIDNYGKATFVPVSLYVNEKLDQATLEIMSGSFDYNKALKDIVAEMTKSGLRTIDYASGRSNRVDVAARRAVMTGLNQITAEISKRNAQILNTDKYEVSWHAGARPSHSVWQGKVYSWEDLEDVCELGEVTGLLGANCRHTYYPFIEGISERTYTDEWLEEQNARENTPVAYGDKEYTLYEATQRQRYLETGMRAQAERVRLLRAGGGQKEDITLAQCKYQALLNEYKDFSKTMGLKTQMERVYIAGEGRIAPGKKVYEEYLQKTTASARMKAAVDEALTKYGVTLKAGKDADVAEMINREVGKAYSIYGDLHSAGYLDRITVRTMEQGVSGGYDADNREIIIDATGGIDGMKRTAQAQYKAGFWSTGEAEHTVRHELGHAAQHMTVDAHPDRETALERVLAAIKARIGVGDYRDDATDEEMLAAGEVLSYYGIKNIGEMSAESVAELLGGNPRLYAQIVISMLGG